MSNFERYGFRKALGTGLLMAIGLSACSTATVEGNSRSEIQECVTKSEGDLGPFDNSSNTPITTGEAASRATDVSNSLSTLHDRAELFGGTIDLDSELVGTGVEPVGISAGTPEIELDNGLHIRTLKHFGVTVMDRKHGAQEVIYNQDNEGNYYVGLGMVACSIGAELFPTNASNAVLQYEKVTEQIGQ